MANVELLIARLETLKTQQYLKSFVVDRSGPTVVFVIDGQDYWAAQAEETARRLEQVAARKAKLTRKKR